MGGPWALCLSPGPNAAMTTIPVSFLCCYNKTLRPISGKKRFIWLILLCHSLSWKEVGAGTQAGNVRKKENRIHKGRLLTGSPNPAFPCWFPPHLNLSYLSKEAQAHLSRGGTIHSGLGIPISIINQENTHISSYKPIFWRQFLIEVSASQ